MTGSNSREVVVEDGNRSEELEWEVRPGGMLVQKRDDGKDDHDRHHDGVAGGPTIRIKVTHGSNQHDLTVLSQSTFGDLKRLIAQETGLEPKEQRLLFRGREKEDQEYLHMAGVKDNAKILLMEASASKETNLEQKKESMESSRACAAVTEVRAEVDKLSEQVAALETAVSGGTRVAEKEFVVLSELLMRQLLKLDSIEAEGEGRVQRKTENILIDDALQLQADIGFPPNKLASIVRRVQGLVEAVDTLKARNSNPFGNPKNATSVMTKWEKFDSGVGSLNAPPPQQSTQVTRDWEVFD